MRVINSNKILIIADIHQCVGGYANKILEREIDWDHIVFLGDYFDCFETPDGKNYFTVSQTCDWLNNKFEEFGNKATWLLGNHDLTYISTYVKNAYPPKNTFYYCSGWTRNKATSFNMHINPKWFDSLELCVDIGNKRICSHAGFHYDHFVPYVSEYENIKRLYETWEHDKRSFKSSAYHWIWNVHPSRGGDGRGSPIWLDWNLEFFPLDNVRQIVGHTENIKHKERRFDENSVDFCIDAHRTCYAIVENGKILIKYINE